MGAVGRGSFSRFLPGIRPHVTAKLVWLVSCEWRESYFQAPDVLLLYSIAEDTTGVEDGKVYSKRLMVQVFSRQEKKRGQVRDLSGDYD